MNGELKTDQIGIVGAGEIGRALGHVLEKAGSRVLYYDREDDRTTTASIGDLVAACNLLLICVPSWASRDVVGRIAKHINPQYPPLIISLSKGVESGFATMDQILRQMLPEGAPYGLLYGPMIASELVAHAMGAGVLALSDNEYDSMVRDVFAKARVYLELSGDLHGTAVCGALKNVYAMTFGVCDGLRLGSNARGRLSVVVVREMKRILQRVGADPATAEGLAGLGDLMASGTDDRSFNYRVGRSIAERIADARVKSEGLATLQELPHAVKLEEFPLANLMNRLVYHYGNPQDFQRFLEV